MSSRAATRSRTSRLLAPPRAGRLGAWAYALRTTNPPPDRDPRALDAVTKWLVATRATCDRKHVGAVLVRDRTILSTGYNGSIRGLPH